MRTEIKANGNIIQATTAREPKPSGKLPHTAGYVATQPDPMTLGRPIMWSLARLIHHFCPLIEAVMLEGVGEFNPGEGSNWPSEPADYPDCSLAYILAV